MFCPMRATMFTVALLATRFNSVIRMTAILVAIAPASALAQPTKPLDQLRQEEALNRAIETIKEMDVKLDAMMRRRERDCERAIGYRPFCDCLLSELPIAWSFSEYVAIAAKTKEENGYFKMSAELKRAYDKVAPIRDRCVKEFTSPQR
jgi:hypothetical protein